MKINLSVISILSIWSTITYLAFIGFNKADLLALFALPITTIIVIATLICEYNIAEMNKGK